MTDPRQHTIQAIRDFADFLEQHPTVVVPDKIFVNVFLDTKAELAEQARTSSWKKNYLENFFYLEKSFGPEENLSFQINVSRENVCRRVVTGSHIEPERVVEDVQWVCEEPSLLAHDPV